VNKLQGREKKTHRSSLPCKTLAVVILFFSLLCWLVYKTAAPIQVLYAYGIMSVVTFIRYAFDKSAARKGRWRTPEMTLHLLALFGGWPGAALAQEMLRHKSKKSSFRIVYYCTVLMNWVILYLFVKPN